MNETGKKGYIINEMISSQYTYNAGSKARNDIEAIACMNDIEPVVVSNGIIAEREESGLFKKIIQHKKIADSWIKQLNNVEENSVVVFQFPVFLHTLLFKDVLKQLRKKRCYTVAIIHDLETLRLAKQEKGKNKSSKRYIVEERTAIPYFDLIVAHNNKMKELIEREMKVPSEKILPIEIFDYLIPNFSDKEISKRFDASERSIAIAGNLKKEKSGYLYDLPEGVHFELYGSNYEGTSTSNIHYNGSFLPEELPFCLNAEFGLVWDGPSASSCIGTYGAYLRYNNPHKTSLYLACGIPVIIWKEAAMAEYILKNKCGFLIDSLEDIPQAISSISHEEYREMKENAIKVGKQLRSGSNTYKIIEYAKEHI